MTIMSDDPAPPQPHEQGEPPPAPDSRTPDDKRRDKLRETLDKLRRDDPFSYPTS
jgi:hypothetical protein